MKSTLAVVIPFYQRDPGVLTRALDSVFAQSELPSCIVIVDDGSPLSPAAEIAARPAEQRRIIEAIEQPNAGPAAARNTGLDHIDRETTFAAFLDSDDVWQPDHLRVGMAALGAANDFYFADYTWPSRSSSRFRQVDLFDRGEPLATRCDSLPATTIYRMAGHFCEAIIQLWPVHLSTVIVRRSVLGHLRLDPRLKHAGEDQMYFLRCALATDKVVFSDTIGMELGAGINIFRRKKAGDFEFSRSRLGNMQFHLLAEPLLADTTAQCRGANRRLLWSNVKSFLRSEATGLVRRGRLSPRLAGRFVDLSLRSVAMAIRS